MPSAKAALAEGGQDGILDDKRGHGVGKLRLKPPAHLDADLALAGRHDEQDAVVEALLPDPPRAAKLVAIILDGIALQRLGDEHDKLVGGFSFQRIQLGRDLSRGLGG